MNLNLLIDIALLFGGVFYMSRLVYLMRNREKTLSTFKRNSISYEVAKKSLQPRRVIFVAVAIVAVLIKTIFDVKTINESYGIMR